MLPLKFTARVGVERMIKIIFFRDDGHLNSPLAVWSRTALQYARAVACMPSLEHRAQVIGSVYKVVAFNPLL